MLICRETNKTKRIHIFRKNKRIIKTHTNPSTYGEKRIFCKYTKIERSWVCLLTGFIQIIPWDDCEIIRYHTRIYSFRSIKSRQRKGTSRSPRKMTEGKRDGCSKYKLQVDTGMSVTMYSYIWMYFNSYLRIPITIYLSIYLNDSIYLSSEWQYLPLQLIHRASDINGQYSTYPQDK